MVNIDVDVVNVDVHKALTLRSRSVQAVSHVVMLTYFHASVGLCASCVRAVTPTRC